MARTYVYGYGGARFTRGAIEGMSNFNHLNPEIQRRTWAMMDAAQDVGQDLGIGSAWRSRARAQELYDLYRTGQRSAPAAPPDRTYHCEKADGYCYAIDFVGALGWMNRECGRFGMRHFANVNAEPWHGQPVEIPTACSTSFRGVILPRHTLDNNDTGDDDDMPTPADLWSYDLNQDEAGAAVPAYGAVMALFESLSQGRGFDPNDPNATEFHKNFWNGIRSIVEESADRNANEVGTWLRDDVLPKLRADVKAELDKVAARQADISNQLIALTNLVKAGKA